jgi:hypothetical protein
MIPYQKTKNQLIVNNNRLSFADNFNQHPFPAASIKFTIKYLFPGAEIKFAVGDGHHHLASHDLALHVCVGIVFADVVPVACLQRDPSMVGRGG